MTIPQLPEVWLRGSIPEIPALLQPIAHAQLQAREEVALMMTGFDDRFLWEKPLGLASAGFHLKHLSGVAERLFTYARGESLNRDQLDALASEETAEPGSGSAELLARFHHQVNLCLDQLKITQVETLQEYRSVGRAGLPSTVMGLLVHSAEHTMRHVGQLLVTVKLIQNMERWL